MADALYETPWHNMNTEIRKSYVFLIAKAQNAPQIKGGHMVPIDQKTFLRVWLILFLQFWASAVHDR